MIELEDLRIATPCNADWNEMRGDDRVRFCGECSRNVYNLSGMSREEATALVADVSDRLCIRMYRRSDGTVMTEDCPVGIAAAARRRARRVVRAVAGAALALFGLGAPRASAHMPEIIGKMVMVADEGNASDSTASDVENVDSTSIDQPEIMVMGEIAWPEPVDQTTTDEPETPGDATPIQQSINDAVINVEPAVVYDGRPEISCGLMIAPDVQVQEALAQREAIVVEQIEPEEAHGDEGPGAEIVLPGIE